MYTLNDEGNISLRLHNNGGAKLNFIQSFAGMTLDEIASWYPAGVTTQSVLDYLTQERLFDVIENICDYAADTHFETDNIGAALGLFDFCIYCDWLAHRACFVMYIGTDSWNLLDEQPVRKSKKMLRDITYTADEYKEYILELEGGDKRYITRSEFIDFLQKSEKHELITSLYDKPYSVDSLFLALYQHGEEFGYSFNDIMDKILVKTDEVWGHAGEANEFIKYYDFLKTTYGKDGGGVFTPEQLVYNFFKKVELFE